MAPNPANPSATHDATLMARLRGLEALRRHGALPTPTPTPMTKVAAGEIMEGVIAVPTAMGEIGQGDVKRGLFKLGAGIVLGAIAAVGSALFFPEPLLLITAGLTGLGVGYQAADRVLRAWDTKRTKGILKEQGLATVPNDIAVTRVVLTGKPEVDKKAYADMEKEINMRAHELGAHAFLFEVRNAASGKTVYDAMTYESVAKEWMHTHPDTSSEKAKEATYISNDSNKDVLQPHRTFTHLPAMRPFSKRPQMELPAAESTLRRHP